ncbi:hypothetical protein [Lacipirellula parvula]|uniref:Uncharacterized protein n=1 Tax=Lacipirellula parvula TaxID=2650471 RepID=A0A5K7XMB6_9BACT|nr:hypothetical protein [Lacipirellula parvula]BBO34159.1 hypothetical protein PLANPX_3771 [Lacipirellula parvula]
MATVASSAEEDDDEYASRHREEWSEARTENAEESPISLFQSFLESNAIQWIFSLLISIWGTVVDLAAKLVAIIERLASIEKDLGDKPVVAPVRTYYTSKTFPPVLEGRLIAETVAHYCLVGKLRAVKTAGGRGVHNEWRITHDEYLRYVAEGLHSAAQAKKNREAREARAYKPDHKRQVPPKPKKNTEYLDGAEPSYS